MSNQVDDGWPPGPRIPELSVDFLNRSGGKYFSQCDGDTSDGQSADQGITQRKGALMNALRDAEKEKSRFVTILKTWDEKHQIEKTKKKKLLRGSGKDESTLSQIRADIQRKHDWEGVLEVLGEAEKLHKNPKGFGIFRKWFRKSADKASLVEPFLDFLPDGEYTSAICGGIKFIVKAAVAAKESRDEVAELVNLLPQKLEDAREDSRFYTTDEGLQIATWFDSSSQLRQQKQRKKSFITSKKLLCLLQSENPLPPNSREETQTQVALQQKAFRAGLSLSEEEQTRAQSMMTNKTVDIWFKTKGSSAVLVNGNSSLERITPGSFFCALLIQSLRDVRPVLILSHFCGLQLSPTSLGTEYVGAKTMLRSLLAQLVAQWHFGKLSCLSKDDVSELKNNSPYYSLEVLWCVFSKLVHALPPQQPLFILIDGINYYETSQLYQDTKKVIEDILSMLAETEMKPMVKVFITTAVRAMKVNDCFEKSEVVWIPKSFPNTSSGSAPKRFALEFQHKLALLKQDTEGDSE